MQEVKMATFNPRLTPINPLETPCVRSCCLDDDDVCLGCGRTLEEIREWSCLDENQRRAVLLLAESRRQQRNRNSWD